MKQPHIAPDALRPYGPAENQEYEYRYKDDAPWGMWFQEPSNWVNIIVGEVRYRLGVGLWDSDTKEHKMILHRLDSVIREVPI